MRWSRCRVTVIFVRFQYNINLHERVLETSQISNLSKILPVRAELLQADRQTDTCEEGNRVLEKSHISNLSKILPVRAELLLADRQTDTCEEANSLFL